MIRTFKHALLIGGTGMLSDVSIWFADQGYSVSVIGRSERKHLELKKKASYPDRINSLMVDFNDYPTLEKTVREAVQTYGPIYVVVSWTPSLPALELVCKIVSEESSEWKLFHVKGSRRYFEDDSPVVPTECECCSIYLGFILEGNNSRWLTNQEISKGVIKSVEKDEKEFIVGTLHPYEKRPG